MRREGRARVDVGEGAIIDMVTATLNISIRRIARPMGSLLHPYHVQLVQALLPGYYVRRE